MNREVVSIDYNNFTDAWEIVLRSREGGRLVIGTRRSSHAAMLLRDGVDEFIESWFGNVAEPCLHLSATGINNQEGSDKIWECDACGWRHYMRTDENGVTHMIPAPLR